MDAADRWRIPPEPPELTRVHPDGHPDKVFIRRYGRWLREGESFTRAWEWHDLLHKWDHAGGLIPVPEESDGWPNAPFIIARVNGGAPELLMKASPTSTMYMATTMTAELIRRGVHSLTDVVEVTFIPAAGWERMVEAARQPTSPDPGDGAGEIVSAVMDTSHQYDQWALLGVVPGRGAR